MRIHILGIGGTFMGGVAALAQAQGHRVTGCDAQIYPPMSTQLERLGIEVVAGYDAVQIDTVAQGANVFIIGNALSRGNPLVEAILERGLAYISGPQWLAENILCAPSRQGTRWILAVAGTHGKTTTASMLAWILDFAGLNPCFLIGGIPNDFNVSARLTNNRFFVLEADEYDTAFFDKRSKFVHYRPRTAILNNLEFDHADIFADLAAIETQFHYFVRTIPASGRLIVNAQSPALERVLSRGLWSQKESFGANGAEWNISEDDRVSRSRQDIGTLSLPLAGRMNRMNALAAIAAAAHVGVNTDTSLAALACFSGVARRLQIRGIVNGITVYDDFAHHPTAIAATLTAVRQQVGQARILAVFELRSNTMKLGAMKAALPESLRAADQVFCFANALDWNIAETLAPLGNKAQVYQNTEELIITLAGTAQNGDHILIMSNGNFDDIHERLLTRLSA
ncbi:MAG: UDP-N-acetylmuramate:L-alanyl-gamma-D-glutamyl-meso-diaminopimelate ligase [Burkholderiales bacterium]|jgi:UDP-N-acetylmuramate: L-alanyl-gamma-D-glutamyl-meso-diaminopimelate ligase|nr:UDP-N-acetylmuramate:L-alanyl-gamma-D-glutamyl-meso-diaminopimelate ligase [Burkholderiales bacterium]